MLLLVVLLLLLAFTSAGLTYDKVSQHFRSKAFGCQPPQSWYSAYFFLFGLDYIYYNARLLFTSSLAIGTRAMFFAYGRTFVVYRPFRPIIDTADAFNYQAFMKTHVDDYGVMPQREHLIKDTLGTGIFSASGPEWSQSKQLVRSGLSRMNCTLETYERCCDDLIRCAAKSQGAVNFKELSQAYMARMSMAMFFGESDRKNDFMQGAATDNFLCDLRHLVSKRRNLSLLTGVFPFIIDLVYGKEFYETKQRVENFTNWHIARAITLLTKNNEEPRTVTAAIGTATDDHVRARREILNLFIGAHDGPANALNELIWLVARAPDVWTKLRLETLGAFEGGKPTDVASLKRLPFLTAVMNEAMRLRPAMSVHARIALRDTVLPHGGGKDGKAPLFVPKGSYVKYCNYALHRDPAVFCTDITTIDPEVLEADVNSFRPERWESISPSRFEFLPFSGGPRACPGEKLGRSAVAYALVRLLKEFERCIARDDREWTEAVDFALRNKHGCWVEFVRGGAEQRIHG